MCPTCHEVLQPTGYMKRIPKVTINCIRLNRAPRILDKNEQYWDYFKENGHEYMTFSTGFRTKHSHVLISTQKACTWALLSLQYRSEPPSQRHRRRIQSKACHWSGQVTSRPIEGERNVIECETARSGQKEIDEYVSTPGRREVDVQDEMQFS